MPRLLTALIIPETCHSDPAVAGEESLIELAHNSAAGTCALLRMTASKVYPGSAV
jgi:hypothetical protein